MSELSTADKVWHVMRQLQTLADYEHIPWYLPDMKALNDFNHGADIEFREEPEVIAFVDDLLSSDTLAEASVAYWPGSDVKKYKVARRLYYLDDWATAGSLVRTVAMNMALAGRFDEVMAYLLGAGDATGKHAFHSTLLSIKKVVRS